ncbi:MAG: glycogen/starch/alpha-glucan phosphorylase [Myxococcota bacterium]
MDRLQQLRELADDAGFHAELQAIKRENKETMAGLIRSWNQVTVSPDSIFDSQIKRIHQYKRQLLNCLHIIALYQAIRDNPNLDVVPRTFVFGGKAAPGYMMAKLHIKLINDVARAINQDPVVRDRIKVVFLANYGVSTSERIIPATDISEQISMAGKEASGTGNMKFAMNGALTLGTLDGANIEIREEVGADNFFLFGLKVDEVKALKARGYNPMTFIERSEKLQRVIAMIESGFFSRDDPDRFAPVVHDLRYQDTYLLCADFEDYIATQQEAARIYRDPTAWTRRVVHNLAGVGKFSSDRTIREYANDIWGIEPIDITLEDTSYIEPI